MKSLKQSIIEKTFTSLVNDYLKKKDRQAARASFHLQSKDLLSETYLDLVSQIDKLKEEYTKLISSNNLAKKENQQLESKVELVYEKFLNHDKLLRQKKLDESILLKSKEVLEDKNKEILSSIVVIGNEKSQIERRRFDIEKEIDQLNIQISNSSNLLKKSEQELDFSQQRFGSLEEKVSRMKVIFDLKQREVRTQSSHREAIQKEIQLLNNEVDEIEANNIECTLNIEKIKKDIEVYKEKSLELKELNNKEEESRDRLENEISQARKEHDFQRDVVQDLEFQNQDLKFSIESKNKEYSLLRKSVQEIFVAKSSIEKEMDELDLSLSKLNHCTNEIKAEIKLIESEKRELSRTVNELKQEVINKKMQLNGLEQSLESSTTEKSKLSSEIEKQRLEIQELTKKLALTKDDVKSCLIEIEQKNVVVLEELKTKQELSEENHKASEELHELTLKKENLTKELIHLKELKLVEENEKSDLSQRIYLKANEVFMSEAQFNTLTLELDKVRVENDELIGKEDSLVKSKNKLDFSIEISRMNLSSLKETKESLERSINKLSQKKLSTAKKEEVLLKELAGEQEKISSLRSSYEKSNNESSYKIEEVNKLQENYKKLKQERVELEKVGKQLSLKKEQAIVEKERLHKDIEQIIAQNIQLMKNNEMQGIALSNSYKDLTRKKKEIKNAISSRDISKARDEELKKKNLILKEELDEINLILRLERAKNLKVDLPSVAEIENEDMRKELNAKREELAELLESSESKKRIRITRNC
ncbi:hypothetical protein [Halobacteriovorax sp. HLS]|uniref:hypothetical protein n=1 Tax=Halobacteriovorax sp. HLS TaxID=2234000 RepID=UPI000FD9F98F|nr:hypothetical protein [Halobacteriovorax sp. HLS]